MKQTSMYVDPVTVVEPTADWEHTVIAYYRTIYHMQPNNTVVVIICFLCISGIFQIICNELKENLILKIT